MKYFVDEFADMKILRYSTDGFDKLTFKQKSYTYYLSEAALWGRDIFWVQNGKKNLELRKLIEHVLNSYKGNKNDQIYSSFLNYAKTVFAYNGNHHHYNKHKIFPSFKETQLKALLKKCDDYESTDMVDYIYRKDTQEKDILKKDFTSLYENVSEQEALTFYQKLNEKNSRLAHGLNTKLIKKENKLIELSYKINGLYSNYIEKIICNLQMAIKFAENIEQKNALKKLIIYFETGDLEIWNEYNILWVKELKGKIDYVNGFIEVYLDPIGHKATYEGLVNINNTKKTAVIKKITDNAQWFEQHSPIKQSFKKEYVQGINAKVIDVVMLSGDVYPTAPIGINLPNSSWIRKKYGSKSVTIVNLTDAMKKASLENKIGLQQEFSSKKEIVLQKKYGTLANEIQTTLHECLGHGSGKLLLGVSDSALKDCHSTIEETRAELFALYYLYDQKLIDLGIFDDFNPAITEYDLYIKNGLITQLVRIPLGKDILQAHMQARKIIAEWCYDKGKEKNVILKYKQDNKTYVKINNYAELRLLFGELLNIIQTITSTGNYKEAKELIKKYGTKVDAELHKEILTRYQKLGLKPYTGFINPVINPIYDNKNIINYKLDYSQNFIEQQLYYGKKYSFQIEEN